MQEECNMACDGEEISKFDFEKSAAMKGFSRLSLLHAHVILPSLRNLLNFIS
jgi:ABC-type antimicrobial peptide transport system permease subunit